MHEVGRVVPLNVGGTRYTTTLSTLLSEQDLYFNCLFGGDWSDTAQPEVFIDRDGELFRHILRFLRASPEGKARVSQGLSTFEKTALAEETMFYQLHRLVQLLTGTATASNATHSFKTCFFSCETAVDWRKPSEVTDISAEDCTELNALLRGGWRIAGCNWAKGSGGRSCCFILLMT
ncbi:BTB/POZ domain-containing protein kctd6 [Trebouxia sp. C0009 RCD-2024]